MMIQQREGDTPLDDIELGKEIDVIVNGRLVKRFFKIIYCENDDCKKILKPKLVQKGMDAGLLYGNHDHNKRKVCDHKCRNAIIKKGQANGTIKRGGKKKTPFEPMQRNAMNVWLYENKPAQLRVSASE